MYRWSYNHKPPLRRFLKLYSSLIEITAVYLLHLYLQIFLRFWKQAVTMGRKTEKSLTKKYKLKTKKQQMQQMTQYLRSHNVNVANRTEDPMKELAVFKKFERNGLSLTVSCQKTHTLDEETTDFIFRWVDIFLLPGIMFWVWHLQLIPINCLSLWDCHRCTKNHFYASFFFAFSIWKETMKPMWNKRAAEADANGFEKFKVNTSTETSVGGFLN